MLRRRFVATIYGVVQGVFFRQSTSAEASRLGIAGAVRNDPDGCVRVVAEGDEEALRTLLAWLHRGPSRAVVERVEVDWMDPRGESGGFRIDG
jgi:acylphosphatase